MTEAAIAFFVGLLFALGLGISGMTQPAKVTAFLDFFGHWDPSLAFVMVGAIAVYAIGFRLVVRRPKPLLVDAFQVPAVRKVDRPLVLGAVLFGIGWGLIGFCPGPAFTALASFRREPIVFVASMMMGMFLFRRFSRNRP